MDKMNAIFLCAQLFILIQLLHLCHGRSVSTESSAENITMEETNETLIAQTIHMSTAIVWQNELITMMNTTNIDNETLTEQLLNSTTISDNIETTTPENSIVIDREHEGIQVCVIV
jgi:hypothetical protein